MQRLVMADTQHARKANCNTAFVTRAQVDAFKTQLKHQRWLDAAHRAKLFQGGFADHAVDLSELFICQAAIGFGKRHELRKKWGRIPIATQACRLTKNTPPKRRLEEVQL